MRKQGELCPQGNNTKLAKTQLGSSQMRCPKLGALTILELFGSFNAPFCIILPPKPLNR